MKSENVTITIAGEELNLKLTFGVMKKLQKTLGMTFLEYAKLHLEKWDTEKVGAILLAALKGGGNEKTEAWIDEHLEMRDSQAIQEALMGCLGVDPSLVDPDPKA